MRPAAIFIAFSLCLGCSRAPDGAPGSKGEPPSEDERPALSMTHWTDVSELFVELPALIVGQDSPCAVHLTKLADFSPLSKGTVTVVLRGGETEERFEIRSPSVPGIFRPVAKPTSSGRRHLVLEVRGEEMSTDHDLGEVMVYADLDAARTALPDAPEPAGRITFLKEQQWPIQFGTTEVALRAIRSSLPATGTVRARSGGDVTITAPMAGRVSTVSGAFPKLGDVLRADETMAVLKPRLESVDLASLELAVRSAELEQAYAERESERLEALRADGAVPDRRVQEALHAAETSRASVAAARRRLHQFAGVQRASGSGEGALQIPSPIGGTVSAVYVPSGGFVEAGEPLFRVLDTTEVWIEARIAEADVSALTLPRGGMFFIEGIEAPFDLAPDSLVAEGQMIDPVTRTLELDFKFDSRARRLPIGTFVRAYIANGEDRSVITVPASAVVDDGGVPVAFVQVEGEAFERRALKIGIEDRGYVEVVSGVSPGEHVVSRGAWSVKFAASSGTIPAHGHAH